jgi:ParB/RepB/Spo0J family partition protein
MDQVTHRLPTNFRWPMVGHPGSVPLWALVPTPDQSRKYIDDEELQELAATMKPENGGQQREILAVRCLTEDELAQDAPARYRIISGERRWRAAHLAGLEVIEIRVKEYVSHAEEMLDIYMLNEGRVGLSDIENADYIAEIMQAFGLQTQAELAQKIGKDEPWVQQHLSLLKLCPSARALMSPKLPREERLRRQVGVFISKLSPETQERLVSNMPKGRVPASQQIIWLQLQLKGTPEAVEPVRHNPYLMRRVVGYFADQVERRASELLAMKDFERLFNNANEAQVLELVGRIKDAQAELGELVTRVEGLSTLVIPNKPNLAVLAMQPAQKPTTPTAVVVQKTSPQKPPAPPILKPAVSPVQRVSRPPPLVVSRPTPIPPVHRPSWAQALRVAPAPSVLGKNRKEKTVIYEDEKLGRKVTDKVTRERYLELWDKGFLGFQIDGKERPAWMPTREAAMEDWDKFCE